VNFRDLGGMAADSGRVLRKKRLLRSAEPCSLCGSDIVLLNKRYDVRTIIDFRTTAEAEGNPVDPIPGAVYHNIDLFPDFTVEDGPQLMLVSQDTIGGVRRFMEDMYLNLTQSEPSLHGYRLFIDLALAQREGAILFHCFAGKDRTGVAAAIILDLLGVSYEDILRDYMRSNRQRRDANRRMIEQCRQAGFTEHQLKILQNELSVRAQYLNKAVTAAEREYGSFRGMLQQRLCITGDEIQSLRENYLER